ncbi:EF-hand calcium-binding domain-containing protein 9 [Cladochytrium tenue]|nr:EF-hand calcium-binding domain-containing protein 9 [Cladochytrium tenue]
MKVKWSFTSRLHLDPAYGLLTARSALLCWEVFKLLDWRGTGSLDDIQFAAFMTVATDLKERQILKVFDIFDLDRSGSVEFDEFFVLISILVAVKDNQAKHFMYQHWRTCFEILDEDGGKTVSLTEFSTLGFLFNFSRRAVKNIYREFDITGNAELDFSEFRLFVLAAIDMQDTLDRRPGVLASSVLALARRLLTSFNLLHCCGSGAASPTAAASATAVSTSAGTIAPEVDDDHGEHNYAASAKGRGGGRADILASNQMDEDEDGGGIAAAGGGASQPARTSLLRALLGPLAFLASGSRSSGGSRARAAVAPAPLAEVVVGK